MHLFDKLNTKIVGLLIAAIFVSMAMIGIVFSLLINDLYEASARDNLRNAANILGNDLRAKRESLVSLVSALVQDKSLISSAYLIHSYQDPKNYSPLVFDVEKQKLVDIMSKAADRAGVSFIAVYGMDGKTVAFSTHTNSIDQSGYYSFKSGKRKAVIQANGIKSVQKNLEPSDKFINCPLNSRSAETAPHYHIIDANRSLAIEVTIPMHSGIGTGNSGNIGWVRAAFFLDQAFVQEISEKGKSQFAIRSDKWTVASTGFDPIRHEHRHAQPFPVFDIDTELATLHWEEGLGGQEGATIVRAMDGREARFIYGQSKGDVFASINTFREAVLLVIFVSTLLVIPIGVYFTRKVITEPIERLTQHAEKISTGEREMLENFPYRGELKTLASTFNVMVDSLGYREQELRSAQQEIEAIIGNAPSAISIKNLEGKYILINPGFERVFGFSSEEVRGKTDFDFFPEDIAEQFHSHDMQVLEEREAHQFEEVVPQIEGDHIYLSIKFPLIDGSGEIFSICSISTDITERKKAENELQLAKRIIESANEAIVVTNIDNVIEDVNTAYEEITGYARNEVLGKKPSVSQSGKHDKSFYQKMWKKIIETGRWEGELWDRRKNGELYPVWMSINTVFDENDEPSHYVGIFNDITSKKETESRLEELAYFDPLTGLPNRLLFRDRLNHEIAACRRHRTKLAVIFIDLDHFKLINDSQGHLAGDKLLEVVGKRLLAKGRDTDTISRLGGDEFTIVLTDVADPEQISAFMTDVLSSISAPMTIFGQSVTIGASAGVAIYPEDGEDMEVLIKNADIALYQAKEQGRNTYQFFSNDLQEKILARVQLEEDLKSAIENNEFVLYYQPKYNLLNREIVGMEALIRWQPEGRAMVMPDQFIPLAEETGLIVPIGEWVLETACKQVSLWEKVTNRKLRVAVNLSAAQLRMEGLVNRIRNILADCGIGHDLLELELTESMVMDDVESAIKTMTKLREFGFYLSIDDFGTGYSSLGHLKRFPLNSVKIDKSFIQDIDKEEDSAIIEAIIAMADKLGMHVIAEGIETEEHLQFVVQAGCNEGQGYLLGKPMPPEDLQKLLEGAE